jgi:hypothetical protein
MRNRLVRGIFTAGLASGLALVLSPGCGSSDDDKNKNKDVNSLFGDGGRKGPCQGLECQIAECGNGTTSITGTVYAPNGTLPLYNVVVYVPNGPLDPIPEGASCDRCGNVSGNPVTATITDTSGHFTLAGVPSGKDIPLVIQVGKWRREIKVPEVKSCASTALDKVDTRLPRNKSEGHIPKIAVTTGRCDYLSCLFPKLGLDASEFTPKGGDGRLNIYRGASHQLVNQQGQPVEPNPVPAPAPNGSPDAMQLWGTVDSLKPYDIVVLSCECDEHNEIKPNSAKTALYEYAKLGGRIFSSHYHYTWFQNSPVQELRDLAEWKGDGRAAGGAEAPFLVDTSFPKGQALADWLVNVAASTTKGRIPINVPRQDVVGVKKGTTTRWVYNHPQSDPETTKYLSFNTPVGVAADQQCGKAVFGDMHITREDNVTLLPDNNFPTSCPKDLTPEEKALIFLFFDLSSCVQNEQEAPKAPVK